jgi:hypothetical protein
MGFVIPRGGLPAKEKLQSKVDTMNQAHYQRPQSNNTALYASIGIGVFLILAVGIWYFFFNKKAPSDPEDMAEAVLETIIDEDFDAFMGMTVATLSHSQCESVIEDLMKRQLEYANQELEDAKRDEEEMWENRIENLEEELEHVEYIALRIYLNNTLDELEYDDWESLKEDLRELHITRLEAKIEDAKKPEEEYLEEALDNVKDEKFRKSDYNDWDDARENRADRWEDAFEDVYDNGEDDVDWDEVEFKKIDYEKDDREAAGEFDIEIHLTYRKDTYILELDDCIETNLGILMADQPRWKGEKRSSSKYESAKTWSEPY